MKNLLHFSGLYLFVVLLLPSESVAQVIGANHYWSDERQSKIPAELYRDQVIVPDNFRLLSLALTSYKNLLETAPLDRFGKEDLILELPMPDNSNKAFRIIEDPMMPAELQSQFPGIRTFRGVGVEDPSETVHLDFTQKGFHAMIMSGDHRTVYIDPFSTKNDKWYLSYYRGEQTSRGDTDWVCTAEGRSSSDGGGSTASSETIGDCQIRKYGLALACTGEYATYHGGTLAGALAAMTTTMNRVNQIFQRDAGIRMEFVFNNTSLIYLNAATDPYTSGAALTMLSENQSNIDAVIGVDNYDIGHVFDIGSGGLATLGSVCNDLSKARGTTGRSNPVGDSFDVDYVAHEIGHQFGANHTFYSDEGSCMETFMPPSHPMNDPTAVEPGSGSTIMAYAGICGIDNVQMNSDDYFHTISLQEIADHVTSTSCAKLSVDVVINAPEAFALADATLPGATTFTLRGKDKVNNISVKNAYDVWEQVDAHEMDPMASMPPSIVAVQGPNFRSVKPTIKGYARTFGLDPAEAWEVVPWPFNDRELTFQMTTRVIIKGYGCAAFDEKKVTFLANAGPFELTNPAGAGVSLVAGDPLTITWDVADTDQAPLNVDKVVLTLVANGTNYLLSIPTANDGSHDVTIPSTVSPTSDAVLRIISFSSALDAKGVSFRNEVSGITITNFKGSDNSSKFVVFPNPTAGQMQLKYHPVADRLNEKAVCLDNFILSDHSGRVVLQEKWETDASTMDIDVSQLSNGVYSLAIFDCEGLSHQEKVVLMK